jgi:hypothetical protein
MPSIATGRWQLFLEGRIALGLCESLPDMRPIFLVHNSFLQKKLPVGGNPLLTEQAGSEVGRLAAIRSRLGEATLPKVDLSAYPSFWGLAKLPVQGIVKQ